MWSFYTEETELDYVGTELARILYNITYLLARAWTVISESSSRKRKGVVFTLEFYPLLVKFTVELDACIINGISLVG